MWAPASTAGRKSAGFTEDTQICKKWKHFQDVAEERPHETKSSSLINQMKGDNFEIQGLCYITSKTVGWQ